jgi:hypothetical protein
MNNSIPEQRMNPMWRDTVPEWTAKYIDELEKRLVRSVIMNIIREMEDNNER